MVVKKKAGLKVVEIRQIDKGRIATSVKYQLQTGFTVFIIIKETFNLLCAMMLNIILSSDKVNCKRI